MKPLLVPVLLVFLVGGEVGACNLPERPTYQNLLDTVACQNARRNRAKSEGATSLQAMSSSLKGETERLVEQIPDADMRIRITRYLSNFDVSVMRFCVRSSETTFDEARTLDACVLTYDATVWMHVLAAWADNREFSADIVKYGTEVSQDKDLLVGFRRDFLQ